MDFFNDENQNNDEKRNIAFQTVSAVRDAVSIASHKQLPPTYEQSLRFIHDLDPELYEKFDRLLNEKNESEFVRFYKEKAAATNTEENPVDAADLMITEKAELERIVRTTTNTDNLRNLKKRILQLQVGIDNLKPRRLTENAILLRDFSMVERSDIFGEVVKRDYKVVDYALKNNRSLRLRLLHPDNEEQITGADLIYEQYDVETNKIKFLFMQYKTWEDNKIYFSNGNILDQLNKLKSTLCDCSYCDYNNPGDRQFKFPPCAGFLRPTDKLQNNNSKMISSGVHIPVCRVLEIAKSSKKLEKNGLRRAYPNHYIFERLFNLDLVGSDWYEIHELEELYKKSEILNSTETLKIYTTEFINSKDVVEDEITDELLR